MIAPPETFTTRRLLIRRPRSDDAEALFRRWGTDAEVTRYLVWRPHTDVSESVAHIERCVDAWEDGSAYVWLLTDRETGELVGSVASRPSEHRVSLGYLVARDRWGRGYMTEALEPIVAWWLAQTEVHRVWAVCDVDNAASARVLEKAGFEREGVLRRWIVHPNVSAEPRDVICFGRVRRGAGSAWSREP